MVSIAAWPTAAMAYQVFYRGIGQFIWLAGGWLTCLLGCVVVKMVPWLQTISSLLVFATLLVVALGSAGFSVGWYRALLVEETSSDGIIPFSLGFRELRYLLYQAAIALIVGAPVALLCLLLGWVAARLILALAAVAIDDSPGRLLREAWRHTSSNGRALFYGWLACIMPVSLLWGVLALVLMRALGVLAGPIVELLAYLCYFVALGLTAGFFSCVMSQFADGALPDEGAGAVDAVAAP